MRHSNRRPKEHSSLWAVLCAAAFLVALGVWHFQPTSEDNLEFTESTTGELDNSFAKSPTNPFAETAETTRLIYPYSVVPGGAHRPEELLRAIANDRVVAAHYSDFDVSKARVVKLPAAKRAYVSYRIKDRVYWTKKKVTLAKGEKLITDGKNYARARCANRVSDSAQAAVSPQEPSPAIMDAPVSTDAATLMAYLPSAVRRGLVPDVLGGSNTGGGSGPVNEGGTPSSGFYGRPGSGGAAFLPAAGGSGSGGTSSGGGTPGVGGGTPGNGTPGGGGGEPTGGTGSGTPGTGGTGNGSPGSNPPSAGTPGSGTGPVMPGQGNGNGSGSGGSNPPSHPGGGGGTVPGGNTPDGQPSGGEGSTPPNQGGDTGNPSSPGGNPPPGTGSEPNLTPPPQGGGATPPNSKPGGPRDFSSPEENPYAPPGDEGNETPVDVTIPPEGGGPNPSLPTTAVPEPASIWLLSAGAASLLALRKRKK